MPDSKFDLGDYVEVKDRIAKFYELFGQGRLVTEEYTLTREPDDKPKVIVRALAYRTPDDPHPGVGLSWMYLPGSTSYTKGSELENVETSAWGRAIGSLGILILRSIATSTEINAKAIDDAPAEKGEGPAPFDAGDGSLIGTAQIGKPPSDFELRVGEDGYAISFRLSDGRKSIKVIARDALAEALSLVRDDVLDQRVQVWGDISQETFTPKGTEKKVTYQVLHLHRIKTPTVTLPSDSEAPSLPLFEDDAELDAAAAAA